MAEPIRERALDQITTLLRGMVGDRPWGGQYPSDPVVKRGYLDEAQINQYPTLFVARRAGSSVKEETTVGGEVGVFHQFLVDVYGYVNTANGVIAGTWLERLWDDTYTTLMRNWTLITAADPLGISQKIDFETEDDYDEDDIKAGFRMGLVVILYESKVIA